MSVYIKCNNYLNVSYAKTIMRNLFYPLMRVLNDPAWLITFFTVIIIGILSTIFVGIIVGGVAKLLGKDFREWFGKAAVIWIVIYLLFGIII